MGEVDFTNKVKLAVAKAADAGNEDAVEVIDALLSQLEEMREALKAIANQDAIELALDPQWAKRIAQSALLSQTDEGERMEGDKE